MLHMQNTPSIAHLDSSRSMNFSNVIILKREIKIRDKSVSNEKSGADYDSLLTQFP